MSQIIDQQQQPSIMYDEDIIYDSDYTYDGFYMIGFTNRELLTATQFVDQEGVV